MLQTEMGEAIKDVKLKGLLPTTNEERKQLRAKSENWGDQDVQEQIKVLQRRKRDDPADAGGEVICNEAVCFFVVGRSGNLTPHSQ